MKRSIPTALIIISTLLAPACVGLVQIGKGPLQVGQPKPSPTPGVSK